MFGFKHRRDERQTPRSGMPLARGKRRQASEEVWLIQPLRSGLNCVQDCAVLAPSPSIELVLSGAFAADHGEADHPQDE